jgi:hypothetical protein
MTRPDQPLTIPSPRGNETKDQSSPGNVSSPPPLRDVGEISVVQSGGRLKISATVDAEGIEKLKSILDKYGEILKLMQ